MYTFEDCSDAVVANALGVDGAGDTVLPGPTGPGETELLINYSTSGAGSIWCEIQDEAGALDVVAVDLVAGIERAVTWHGSSELKHLVRRPVRIRFVLKDADLYSMRFR